MKNLVFILAIAVVTGNATSARADQCEALSKKQADAAKLQLDNGVRAYAKLCAPCGDAKPQVGTATTVEIKKVAKTYQVIIDGSHTIDAAYVYIPSTTKANEATNLAKLVGCKATGVPPTIDLGTAQWWLVVPKSTDKFVRVDGKTAALDIAALAGSWSVTTTTELSTCANDAGGTKASYTWTATATNGQLKIKSSSGGAFTGALDAGSNSLVISNDGNRSGSLTQLVVSDAKTLSGRQVQALPTNNKTEPACAVYRTVTATKAN